MPPLLIGEESPLLGELVRSAGETCNSFHTQAAQQPLFNRGDDGAAGLLNAVGGRQPENISGIARLEHPGRESRTASVSREFSSFTQTPSFHKKIKPAGNLSPRPPAGSFSVAPAGVEPTMGESKSPALPLGDGAPVRISIVEFLSFVKQKRFAVSVQSVLPHFYHVFTVSLS